MGLVSSYPGVRPKSAKRMVLDAGSAWWCLNITAFETSGIEDATSTPFTFEGVEYTPRPLGATRGGAVLRPNKEEVDVEVNGIRVPVRGFQRVNSYAPEIEITLLETADADTLKLGLGQSDVSVTPSGYIKQRPRLDIRDIDYIPNIAILASTTEDGQTKPAVFIVENVKVVEAAEIPFEDPGEVALTVNLRGHALPGALYTVPCAFYTPVPEDAYEPVS